MTVVTQAPDTIYPDLILPSRFKAVNGMIYVLGTGSMVYHGLKKSSSNLVGQLVGFMNNRELLSAKDIDTGSGEWVVDVSYIKSTAFSRTYVDCRHLTIQPNNMYRTRIITPSILERTLLV